MKNVLLVLSAIVTISATIPYLWDILKRRTKPRIVSWFNWSLLAGISAAAALADKQYASAVLAGAACIETLAVVVLGIRYGDTKFEIMDVICQLGAIIGLMLWVIFNSPLMAIIANIGIDLIVTLPTLRHIWRRPYEETSLAFSMAAAGGFLALLATTDPKLSGLIFPIYIVFSNLLNLSFFYITPHRHDKPSIKHTI